MVKNALLSFSLFIIVTTLLETFTNSQLFWLKSGSYAVYYGQAYFIVFRDHEYWASDYHIHHFDTYFKWNITELNADEIKIHLKLEIFNGTKLISFWETCINADAQRNVIIMNASRTAPLMLWTSAKKIGDIVSLPNGSTGYISEESLLFETYCGFLDILRVRASADILAEEEKAHLEWVYGFDKDTGLLVHIAGGTIDPIFKAFGIRYLALDLRLKETNVPIKPKNLPSITILIAPLTVLLLLILIGITVLVLTMLRGHKKISLPISQL